MSQILSACIDIETSNLNADFGIVLCAVVKGNNEKPTIFRADKMCKTWDTQRSNDKEIVQALAEKMAQYDIWIVHNGCVTPGHRVLTSDFQWVPVENLKPGDALFTISENVKSKISWQVGFVEKNFLFLDEVYRLCLSDGGSLFSNGEHPWLVTDFSGKFWLKTKYMFQDPKLSERYRLVYLLPIQCDLFDSKKTESLNLFSEKPIVVEAVEKFGISEVCGLQVSNGTYIVEGFGSHNSKFDIPYLRTRLLRWGLPMLPERKLLDPVLIARNKLKLSFNGLGQLAELLQCNSKTNLQPDIWIRASLDGDKKAMDYIVKHCLEDVLTLEKITERIKYLSSSFNCYGSAY